MIVNSENGVLKFIVDYFLLPNAILFVETNLKVTVGNQVFIEDNLFSLTINEAGALDEIKYLIE